MTIAEVGKGNHYVLTELMLTTDNVVPYVWFGDHKSTLSILHIHREGIFAPTTSGTVTCHTKNAQKNGSDYGTLFPTEGPRTMVSTHNTVMTDFEQYL